TASPYTTLFRPVAQARRQAAGPATDLQDHILRSQLGGAHDQIEKIEVDEEVLPELVLGVDTALAEEVAQVGEGLARVHRRIQSWLTEWSWVLFHSPFSVANWIDALRTGERELAVIGSLGRV